MTSTITTTEIEELFEVEGMLRVRIGGEFYYLTAAAALKLSEILLASETVQLLMRSAPSVLEDQTR